MSVDAAISLLLALLDNAARISALITQARADGRTELDPADWTVILAADDAARAALTPTAGPPPAADPLTPEGTAAPHVLPPL